MSWTRVKDTLNTFCTFASDIEAFCSYQRRQPRCPVCRKEFTVEEQRAADPVYDHPELKYPGEDLVEFHMDHTCGAHIIIFND